MYVSVSNLLLWLELVFKVLFVMQCISYKQSKHAIILVLRVQKVLVEKKTCVAGFIFSEVSDSQIGE